MNLLHIDSALPNTFSLSVSCALVVVALSLSGVSLSNGGQFTFSSITTGRKILLESINQPALMNRSWAPGDSTTSGWRCLLFLKSLEGIDSSSATQCPAAGATTLFITITIRVLWAQCVNLSRDCSFYGLILAHTSNLFLLSDGDFL